MVDNGTLNFSFGCKNIKGFLKQLSNHGTCRKMKSDGSYYIVKLFNEPDFTANNNFKNNPKLQLNIFWENGIVKINVRNSLRKWYYGSSSMRNFNKTDFIKCLHLISKKLDVDYNTLTASKITKLEIGLNLRFEFFFQTFLSTIIEHERLKNDFHFSRGTSGFEGENLSLIFYDKLRELFDHGKINSRVYRKLSEKYFFLRVEAGFKKISGVPFAKKNLSSVNDLLTNWEEVYGYLLDQLRKVTYIDWISPRIDDELKFSSYSEIKEYFIFLLSEFIGMKKLFQLLQYTDRPSIHKKQIIAAVEKFRKLKNPSYKEVFFQNFLDNKSYILS
ncbi:MAG: hypothetical protein CFE23_09320 [Flavobacterium sp. BFFFF1]|uniref:hypothetical protein n=1 Tax=Flavobacterium sp. BFFFF1 TaxID=2015557 RepID=UPI000BD7F120|nr:hypothetical protein [Flavobacterium sp. BFFFF1]OYU80446.1 MAG: hypothetical protein CFE23_09320 [Flavobacterium sp. BFFFF1]